MKMSCKKYQKNIYLYKEGELSTKEKQKLEMHLSQCPDCSKEAENVISDFSKLSNLKVKLEFTDFSNVLNDIERSIRFEQNLKTPSKKKFINDMLEKISIPKTRFVFSAIAVLLMMVLVAQEVFVLSRISTLENRMSEHKTKTQNLSHLEFAKFLSPNQDQVTVDKQTLENILESYTDLQLTNKILLEALRKAVPELDEDFIDNGIDQEEMKKLLDKKDIIYSLIREL